MYRKRYQPEPQIPLDEFQIAFGGRLSRENRWVKLADLIPWDEVEKRYAKQFSSSVGNPAYPVRVAFGALLIKEKLKITDEETVDQMRENPYLQYFIGKKAYSDKPPFASSTMVYFRLRLSADILNEINAVIVERAERERREAAARSEKCQGRFCFAGFSRFEFAGFRPLFEAETTDGVCDSDSQALLHAV